MSGDSENGRRESGTTASADTAEGTAPEGAVALDRESLDFIRQPGNEDLLTFYRYWDSMRSDPTEIPLRDRFDPIEIAPLLGKVFLAEIVDGPEVRVRFRVIGSQIVDLDGANHSGRFLDEMNPDPDSEMRRHYTDLIEHRRIYVRQDTAYWSGRELFAYGVLMLPLASEDGAMSQILGLMHW